MQRKDITVGMKVAVYVDGNLRRQTDRHGETEPYPQVTYMPTRRVPNERIRIGRVEALDTPRVHRPASSYNAGNMSNTGILIALDEPVIQRDWNVKTDERCEVRIDAVVVQPKHILRTANEEIERRSMVVGVQRRQREELLARHNELTVKVATARDALDVLGIDHQDVLRVRDTALPVRESHDPARVLTSVTVSLTLDQLLKLALDRGSVV